MPATIVSSFADVTDNLPTVLVVGNFDGVHRGHQALLQAVVESAEKLNARPAVLTFYPHPREVIQNRNDPFYLSRFEERLERITEQGIELIVTHPFNEEVRHTPAARFVRQMVSYLKLKQLWGGSFSLGYRREGDFDYLTAAGLKNDFTVHLFEPLHDGDGTHISSTEIRQLLRNADVAQAAVLLGRPYAVTGEVVLGKQLGRTIGTPTANIANWDKQLLPAHGVYATWIELNGIAYKAATNVGVRPTVDGGARVSVEAHILDFDADIYGQHVRLDFAHHIRPEQKFNGLDELKAQISRDVDQIRNLL